MIPLGLMVNRFKDEKMEISWKCHSMQELKFHIFVIMNR
jgi:hypothetical protein